MTMDKASAAGQGGDSNSAPQSRAAAPQDQPAPRTDYPSRAAAAPPHAPPHAPPRTPPRTSQHTPVNDPFAAPSPDGILLRDDGETPVPDDDTQRRRAADRLSQQLEIGVDLAAVCEHLAALPKKGRLDAIYAAARLSQANAQLARAMAQLLKVERRHTTIVQHIQPPAPISKHSNSTAEGMDALAAKMLRYMELVASETFDPVLEEATRDAEPDAEDAIA